MNVPNGEAVERPFAESFAQFVDFATPAEVAGWMAGGPSTIGLVVAVVAVACGFGAALCYRHHTQSGVRDG